MGVVPVGLFPSHGTGSGEGYGWGHIEAYSRYAKESTEDAWNGLEEMVRAEDRKYSNVKRGTDKITVLHV